MFFVYILQSQWQVLDERVIDEREVDREYEVQYLPEIRTVMPPPSVEYVEVNVCVCVCKYIQSVRHLTVTLYYHAF
jgi:hypothetical protein